MGDKARIPIYPDDELYLWTSEPSDGERLARVFRETWKWLKESEDSQRALDDLLGYWKWSPTPEDIPESPHIELGFFESDESNEAAAVEPWRDNKAGCSEDGHELFFCVPGIRTLPDHMVGFLIARQLAEISCTIHRCTARLSSSSDDWLWITEWETEDTLRDWGFSPEEERQWYRENQTRFKVPLAFLDYQFMPDDPSYHSTRLAEGITALISTTVLWRLQPDPERDEIPDAIRRLHFWHESIEWVENMEFASLDLSSSARERLHLALVGVRKCLEETWLETWRRLQDWLYCVPEWLEREKAERRTISECLDDGLRRLRRRHVRWLEKARDELAAAAAFEKYQQRLAGVETGTAQPWWKHIPGVDEELLGRLRKAIKVHGNDASSEGILKEVRMNRKRAMWGLRVLQARGEYSGFSRGPRSQFLKRKFPSSRTSEDTSTNQ